MASWAASCCWEKIPFWGWGVHGGFMCVGVFFLGRGLLEWVSLVFFGKNTAMVWVMFLFDII